MSTAQFELIAELRSDLGKGASRRLRREGKVPAILYGSHQEPTSIMLSANELGKSLKHEAFYNHILTVQLEGKTERAVLKDLQRHPYKPTILHVDLQRVNESEKLHMNIPLHFTNEMACVGVKMGGGSIFHQTSEVEIHCLPKDLPEYLEVDMLEMDVGQTLHLSDLTLPEGVVIPGLVKGEESDLPVASIQKRGGSDDDEAEATEEVVAE
ncbi:50S ribosomal protein L25/general stress protein Ctc [Candidatus Albibeggiatoa sp. nov. BB20]|uniref:50S ribosomal protein L25/general stress protein Ctc n=1 Tax=Candidatus Albibeggiatoa sp. nov. BB20 TaxID=3162723 RepID=UPI003365ACDF